MTLDADQIVDRRRLSRKLSFWRVAAFLLALAVIAGLVYSGTLGMMTARGAHVARVDLTGVIVDNREQIELLDRVARSRSARALIVSIDSPGGTTAGSEALYEALRRVAEDKPVVAQMGTLATSGGYAAALGADHIVARRNTITGSIGVLVQWADISELMTSIGVEFESEKSSPLKASPNPFEPATEEARQALRSLVLDSYDWFVELVAERRGLASQEARSVGDGRIMTGRQALDAGLVDELGGEEEARDWLAAEHGIDRDLPVRQWSTSSGLSSYAFAGSAGWLARALGLETVARSFERSLALSGAGLDGLVSVWHPQTIEE